VFNDTTTSRNTFAYPTRVYDPAGNYSEVEYRFDIGANVWAQSPAPQGQSVGKTTERVFDSIGRLSKETIANTGAYTRYEYPTNGLESRVYSTIIDTNSNDTGDSADEVLTESWADGAGRTRFTRMPHTFSGGSTATWAGTVTEYDILGRVKRQSVPTEVDSSWNPTGDDSVFLWTVQKYDWMGRVVRTINTDGADSPTLNDSDILISYEGCGCAGGLETTIQSELVPRDDTTGSARRTQKVYEDIHGRSFKKVVMNWDGSTPYTTTVQKFNGRDQVTLTRQYAGSDTSQTFQDVTMTYDGHGRTKTRHYPIEDAQTETIWNYNADDTVSQIADPRGAITNFTYGTTGDARPLLTEVSYSVPQGSGIPVTPTTTFTFDNAGNRTSMTTAGISQTTYAYDELSRITSETIDFDDLTSNYSIGYGYELSGKLKSVTDPFSAVVNYNDDRLGRTTSITGSGFGSVSTYAYDIEFRAFGAVKEMTYGSSDNSTTSYEFDNRLRIDSYQSTSSVVSGGHVRKAAYDYFPDGQTKAVDNVVDSRFDQAYKFDHVGRMTSSVSGLVTNSQEEEVPAYAQGIQYNAFGDMTSRGSSVWGNDDGFTATYINGRKQNSDEIYDAAGNIVENPTINPNIYDKWEFDASGRITETESRWYDGAPQQTSFDKMNTTVQTYDGDGRAVKRHETKTLTQVYPPNTTVTETTEYYVRSSVLSGRIMTELKSDGTKKLTNVFAGSGILAEQRDGTVQWRHEDIVTGSYKKMLADGSEAFAENPPSTAEFEPLGGIVPQEDPNPEQPDYSPFPESYRWGGNLERPESGCALDGVPILCSMLADVLRAYRVSRIEVNTRAEGGFGLAQRLRGAFTIKTTSLVSRTRSCDQKGNNCGPWESETRVHYELLESPVLFNAENSGTGTRHPDRPAPPIGDTWECRTLADLIESPAFKEAAQSAWDRSVERGFKHEQGVYFFYTPNNPGFSYWNVPRNSKSVFTPWIPERAKEVAGEDVWTASLHTHPFRHRERIDENSIALEPWEPSEADIRAQKEDPSIWHITLYPSFNTFKFFVMIDGMKIEPKYWKNYVKCRWKKTSIQ
jgi:YD repeat-containing protein